MNVSKTIQLFFVVCYTVFLYSCHSITPKNDLNNVKLKGKVISLEELKYRVQRNSEPIEKNNLYQKNSFKYNPQGNLIEENIFDSIGNLKYNFRYQCDTNGRQLVEFVTNVSDSMCVKIFSSYDKKGNKIGEMGYLPDSISYAKDIYKYE